MTAPTPDLSPASLEALARLALDDIWPSSLTDPTVRALAARFLEAEALLREAGEVGALIERADERLDEIHDQDAGTWQLGGLFEVEELVCAAAGRARRLAAKIRGRG